MFSTRKLTVACVCVCAAVAVAVVVLVRRMPRHTCFGRNDDDRRYPGVSLVDRRVHDALYKIMDDVRRMCDDAGIACWGVCGTALGAARHGGIVPWDDDIDLAIDARDASAFERVLRSRSNDFTVCRPPANRLLVGVWKIGHDAVRLDGEITVRPRIDVHIMAPTRNRTTFVFARPVLRVCFAKTRIPHDGTDGRLALRRVAFGPTLVDVPAKLEAYLSYEFGSQWQTECRVAAPHGPLDVARTRPFVGSRQSFSLTQST